MRSEACVCGGVIVSSSISGVRLAIQRHNQSLRHRIWRYNREVPTAAEGLVDMSGPEPVRPDLPAMPLER